MNILLVKSSSSLGGAEVLSFNLIKGFKIYQKKVKIFFITTSQKLYTQIDNLGVKAYFLNTYNEELGIKRDLLKFLPVSLQYLFKYLREIISVKKKENVDLVIFQTTTEKIILTFALKLLGIKTIWFEHGPFFETKRSRLILILYRILSIFTHSIITVSKTTANDLVKGGINPIKVITINTGIDVSKFKPLNSEIINWTRETYKIAKEEKIIGYLGNVTREKGIETFINIAEILIKKNPKVKFLIVGEGDFLNEAICLIKNKKLINSFIFVGFKNDVKSFVGIFDLFFFPTFHKEGISLSMLEAMSMGIVVVTRDIGGNKDLIVDERTGFLFSKETNEEIADKIIYLLKHPEIRERIGKNARERIIKHFNEKDWINKMHLVFQEVVNEK